MSSTLEARSRCRLQHFVASSPACFAADVAGLAYFQLDHVGYTCAEPPPALAGHIQPNDYADLPDGVCQLQSPGSAVLLLLLPAMHCCSSDAHVSHAHVKVMLAVKTCLLTAKPAAALHKTCSQSICWQAASGPCTAMSRLADKPYTSCSNHQTEDIRLLCIWLAAA